MYIHFFPIYFRGFKTDVRWLAQCTGVGQRVCRVTSTVRPLTQGQRFYRPIIVYKRIVESYCNPVRQKLIPAYIPKVSAPLNQT